MKKLKMSIKNVKRTSSIHKIASIIRGRGDQVILLEYTIKPTSRYGCGKPSHPILYEIINNDRSRYRKMMEDCLRFKEYFLKIPTRKSNDYKEPLWINRWLPGLDSVVLYSFLCLNKSKRYFEVGSGYSTKFARRAISDHNLPTKITSIDPCPRADINAICDTVIRQPLEDIDLRIFDELYAGDIFFIDGTHYCFMNSDVVVVFLDILPRLRPGVFVSIHDIFLPYDYPQRWADRYYNEQYLLASYILAKGKRLNIILPAFFISEDQELKLILDPIWNNPEMDGIEKHGVSFWLET